MPGGNGTGPMGAGPMTGRGMGTCAENNALRFATGGRGLARGFCNRFFSNWRNAPQSIDKADQIGALKAQLSQLQQQITRLEESA